MVPAPCRLHIVGGLPDRGLRLRIGDEFGVRHRRQHGLGALLGAFRIAVRRQPRRRLDQARQHRGFRQRDVLGGLAEIALRGRLHAIGAGAEIDPVEIELENFRFGMLALQPEREFDFLQFALQRALLRQEQVLGELLGQRRAALRDAAMQDVGHRRARDADRIDAVMRIEPAVLDGDEGLRQIGRQILQRDIGAGHFAARRQHAAVEADDLDGRRPLRNFKRLDRRQMRADPDDDADRRDDGPQAEHRAPVEQAARCRCAHGPWICACRCPGRARGLRSRGASSPASAALRLGDGFFGLSSSAADAILRAEAQFGQRRGEPELRLLASAALFSSPRHTQTPLTPVPPHASGRDLRAGYAKG